MEKTEGGNIPEHLTGRRDAWVVRFVERCLRYLADTEFGAEKQNCQTKSQKSKNTKLNKAQKCQCHGKGDRGESEAAGTTDIQERTVRLYSKRARVWVARISFAFASLILLAARNFTPVTSVTTPLPTASMIRGLPLTPNARNASCVSTSK